MSIISSQRSIFFTKIYFSDVEKHQKFMQRSISDRVMTNQFKIKSDEFHNFFYNREYIFQLLYQKTLMELNSRIWKLKNLRVIQRSIMRSQGTTVNLKSNFFPGTNVTSAFNTMRHFEPRGPLVNSEFYPGWLDYWGQPHNKVIHGVLRDCWIWRLWITNLHIDNEKSLCFFPNVFAF